MTDFAQRIAALSPEKRALLEARLKRPAPSNGAAPSAGPQEVSFAQERIWTLAQNHPESDHFVLTTRFRVPLRTLREAVTRVVERHEALRTEIVLEGERPVQIVKDPPADPFVSESLEEAMLGVRSMKPPLFRALVAADELILVAHAIVCDGPSLALLRCEILSETSLPPVRLQPADYARKQRQRLSGARIDGLVGQWRPLEQAPALLALHTDRPRRPNGLPEVRRYAWESDRSDRTPFWAAVLSIVLSRFARQDSVVLGIQTRRPAGFVGVATNTLPLIVEVGDSSFHSLAERIDQDLKSIRAQEELPYEKLVSELRIRRSSRHNPLFQAVLAVRSELDCEGDPTDPWFSGGSVLFDVALAVDGNRLELLYDSHLFEEDTIRALAGAIETVAKAERSEDPISTLPMLERASFDDRPLPSSPKFAATIHGIFERRAALSPKRIALKGGREKMTYGELNARSNRLARALMARGVQRGQTVGVHMDRSIELIVAFLAILKTGAAYLPLDPQYPPARLAFMMEDSGASLILSLNELAELEGSDQDASNLGLEIGSGEAAYVIYTSGSTGEPKGVVVPHAGVCHAADEQVRHFGLTDGERVLQFSSPNFDASVFEFVMAPRCGGELHLAETEELIPGPPLLGLLKARGITALTIPPSTLAVLAPIELQDLRVVIVAGEACGAELVARWAPGRRFFNAYGPTEASIWATVTECATAERAPSIGRPVAHMWVRVVDRQLRPLPAGAPGELLLGGPGIALCYLNRPELTAERFIHAPHLGPPDVRWYRTGDVVRADSEGRLWYLGRADRQLKVRGFRIEPAEVEAHLLQIPGVSSAAVEVESDALVAYYTADGPTLEEIQETLARQLPQHMVPQRFVALDAMPVGPTGKLDRGALAGLSRHQLAGSRPARNETERALVEIWKTVLQIEDVGIDVDFFSLGGHSLLAASVMSRASEALGRELPLRTLFRSRTIASLAEAFQETPSSEVSFP